MRVRRSKYSLLLLNLSAVNQESNMFISTSRCSSFLFLLFFSLVFFPLKNTECLFVLYIYDADMTRSVTSTDLFNLCHSLQKTGATRGLVQFSPSRRLYSQSAWNNKSLKSAVGYCIKTFFHIFHSRFENIKHVYFSTVPFVWHVELNPEPVTKYSKILIATRQKMNMNAIYMCSLLFCVFLTGPFKREFLAFILAPITNKSEANLRGSC